LSGNRALSRNNSTLDGHPHVKNSQQLTAMGGMPRRTRVNVENNIQ
jgi:hypothetical protein